MEDLLIPNDLQMITDREPAGSLQCLGQFLYLPFWNQLLSFFFYLANHQWMAFIIFLPWALKAFFILINVIYFILFSYHLFEVNMKIFCPSNVFSVLDNSNDLPKTVWKHCYYWTIQTQLWLFFPFPAAGKITFVCPTVLYFLFHFFVLALNSYN